jgi:adenosylmethionine-8-amino-7-oxononanoate aminotransferase
MTMRTSPAPWPFLSREVVRRTIRAERCEIWDSEGRFLDAASGAINVNLGYGNSQIVEAVSGALHSLSYLHPEQGCDLRDALLARLLDSWLPLEHSDVFFACTGAESIEVAMRVALHHHWARGDRKKRKFLSLEIGYHGASFATMRLSSQQRIPDALKSPEWIARPRLQELPIQDPNSFYDDALSTLRRTLEEEADIAGLVAEPINGSSGAVLMPPVEFWRKVDRLCKQAGSILVLDETMTGYGRTGSKFAFEQYGIIPDVLVAGKGLAAGYANINAISVARSIADELAEAGISLMSATMAAQPAACAAALTVLELIDRQGLTERVANLGIRLGQEFAALRDAELISRVRGKGAFWGIDLPNPRHEDPDDLRTRALAVCRKNQLRLYPAGWDRFSPSMIFAPPLNASNDELDEMLHHLRTSLMELRCP